MNRTLGFVLWLLMAVPVMAQQATVIEISDGVGIGIAFTKDGEPVVLTNVVILRAPKPNPTKLAAQLIVLRDQATTSTKKVAVLLDLQAKYQKGSVPEMFLLDKTDTSKATTKFNKLKPPNAGFPYYFLTDKDGVVLAHGELAETTDANVAIIEKYREKR